MGATYQFQMCHTNECEDIYNDPREEQCRTWEPDFELHSNKHHWLPYEHPDRECTHPPRVFSTYLSRTINHGDEAQKSLQMCMEASKILPACVLGIMWLGLTCSSGSVLLAHMWPRTAASFDCTLT